MLDRLLGRAELKESIEELEEDRHHLQRRLEAEEDRRADAVSAKQAAEAEINRLEDRIESLEDRVERLQGDEPDLGFRRVETVRGDRAAALVSRLQSLEAPPEGVLTAFVEDPDSIPLELSDHFDSHVALVRRAAPALVVGDDAGLLSAAIDVPIDPDPFVTWDDSLQIEESWFVPKGRFCFGIVRADTFAIGVYEGTERVAFEGFESEVKETHSKGGFSQRRFERRRDEQIETHLGKVRDAIDDVRSEAGPLDRTILVGDRRILSDLRDVADVTDVTDASGKPKAALANAFDDFWTCRVYGI